MEVCGQMKVSARMDSKQEESEREEGRVRLHELVFLRERAVAGDLILRRDQLLQSDLIDAVRALLRLIFLVLPPLLRFPLAV
jgi:hypothetical protein